MTEQAVELTMPAGDRPDYDLIYGLDESGVFGVHLVGHLDDSTAAAWGAWLFGYEDIEAEYGLTAPRRQYVRKVPHRATDSYMSVRYAYSDQPGPGASPITRIEAKRKPMPPCAEDSCTHESLAGIPDASGLNAWPEIPAGEYRYLCREHYLIYEAAHRAEIAERLAAMAGEL